MIRFRHKEDEQRYLRLLSQVYRLTAASLPAPQATVVLRNLGKMQDMLLYEGVRQGVAAAGISVMQSRQPGNDDKDLGGSLSPFKLHALVYDAHDTPLRNREERWLDVMGIAEDAPPSRLNPVPAWLDPQPMEFAPDTEADFLANKAPAGAPPPPPVTESGPGEELDDDVDLDALFADDEDGDIFESPQSLARIRDALQEMRTRPSSWQEMILTLSRYLHIDAAFLDMQLNTAMGRTVLSQVNLAHLHPESPALVGSAVTFLSPQEAQQRVSTKGDE